MGKEKIEKANRIRMASVQKAEQLVPRAAKEFDEKAAKKKSESQKKAMEMDNKAMKMFRAAGARSIKIKEQAALRHTSVLNRLTSDHSRRSMEFQSEYQKKL